MKINVVYEPSYHQALWWWHDGKFQNVAGWSCEHEDDYETFVDFEFSYDKEDGDYIQDVHCTACGDRYLSPEDKANLIYNYDWDSFYSDRVQTKAEMEQEIASNHYGW